MALDNLLHLYVSSNPHEIPSNRLRGTSTAIALRCISDAILKPETRTVVKDHANTRASNQHLLNLIEMLVKRLRLVGFSCGYDDITAQYWLMCSLTVQSSKHGRTLHMPQKLREHVSD